MKIIPTLLLLALSVFSAPTSAQTKEATEAWIIEQSADNIAGLSYEIDGDTLKSVYEYPSLGSAGGGTTERTVQLRDVKTISMVHTDTALSFKLVCETDCTYVVNNDSNGKFEAEAKHKGFLFEIYRKLDKSYPPRMQKALLHLVKLHGGDAKIVAPVIKKEAF